MRFISGYHFTLRGRGIHILGAHLWQALPYRMHASILTHIKFVATVRGDEKGYHGL